MTTLILAHRRISSSLPLARLGAVRERMTAFFESPAIGGIAATFVLLGAILYISMLLMSFNLGVRMRDIAIHTGRYDEEVRRMELLEREREAGFAFRHEATLKNMQEIADLKYLTPKNASLSEARTTTPFHQ